MKITLEEFEELVDFIKEHNGKFTKEELWEEYFKRRNETNRTRKILY